MFNTAQSPYHTEDGKPLMRPSVAAFVDFLGYRHYVKEAFRLGRGNEELQKLYESLSCAYQHLKEMAASKAIEGGKPDFVVRTFTDNLVIGFPFPSERHDAGIFPAMMVISYIGFLQAELAKDGYFTRGGIAAGDLYIDDDIVFGPALMEAYDAEGLAKHPRVVLCGSAQDIFKGTGWYGSKVPDVLFDPNDGQIFVDYLEHTVMIAGDDDNPFTEYLDGHKLHLTQRLVDFQHDSHVLEKYQWAAVYHNAFCDANPRHFNESDKVVINSSVQPPQPWIAKPASG
jgi:hypothetical protein